MILFSASIEDFEVKPKGRPRVTKRGGVYCKSAKNQTDLATLLKQFHKGKPIDEQCIISWVIHLPHRRRCDVDNLNKQVMDAMEEGGIITDDYLIRGTDKTRLYQGKKVSRIVVNLKRMEESNGD